MTNQEKAALNKGRIIGILDAMSLFAEKESGVSVEMFEEFREELEKAVEDLFFLIEKECGMKNAECENGDEIDAVSEGAPWETPIVRNGKCGMQNEDWRVPGDETKGVCAVLEILTQKLQAEKKNFKPAKR